MKKAISNIFILFLICNCSGNNSANKKITEIDEFKTYSIDVESKSISISEIVESAEILRLEETSNSLLANFYGISRLGTDFVFGAPNRGEVYVFDEFGNFKSQFSKQGSGPKEYSFMLNTWVEGDTIAIFDSGLLRIQKYDSRGNYLASNRVPQNSPEITFWKGRYYLDVSTGVQDDGKAFGVRILDKKMQLLEDAIPLKAKKPVGVFWRSPFISYGDQLTYHDAIRDTVYVRKEGTFKPLLSIDFGEKWAWRDQSLLMDQAKAKATLKRRGIVDRFGAIVGKEHILVQNIWAGKIQGHLVNRKTGNVQRLKIETNSKVNFSLTPFYWDGDKLLASLSSADVAQFISSVGSERIKFRTGTTLEEIESSENPVLVWMMFN